MRTKSSLGQHFLKNPGVVEKIIRLAGVEPGDTVLEIGPGTGALTRRLLEEASRVIAVEKDDVLSEDLKGRFGDAPNLRLVHADILACPFEDLVSGGVKLVANLPYNIATQIILRLVDVSGSLACAVVMVQKEVGERICAKVGEKDYSALTVILSAVFDCAPGFLVGPNNFHPAPKVDSLVIRLTPRKDPLPRAELDDYKKIAFGAFGMRRKMLRNSLLSVPGITKELLPELSRLSGVSLDDRPQKLGREDFMRLTRAYRQIINS